MPTRVEIEAAECRVSQSRLIAHDRFRGVLAAYRATLARPSTVVLVMATAGMASFCLTRQMRNTSSPAEVRMATKVSVAGVVGTLIVQYGMQYLPFFIHQIWAASQALAASAGPELSEAPGSNQSLHA